jgi:hypothetical protein
MGVFKEASYFGNDAFFEQLFKHEGVCLWNDDDLYEFMSVKVVGLLDVLVLEYHTVTTDYI